MCVLKITVMFAYSPKQIAQTDYKTIKMMNISTCEYMQIYIPLYKAFLKLKNKL